MPGSLRVEHADVVILGAGLAGASLAWRLAAPKFSGLRVIVLEPRRTFEDDRTWCSWRTQSHPFSDDVLTSWRRLEIRWPGGATEIRPSAAYDCLPARRFYDRVLPRLDAAPNISLRLGTRALDVRVREAEISGHRSGAGSVVVESNHGRIEAACVFDSRPPEPPSGSLVQHFAGWEIEADEPCFDSQCATLMDFDVVQDHSIHFMYVLPITSRRALIESTWIEPGPGRRVDYERHMRSWIASRATAASWRVLREERGSLPMTTAPMTTVPMTTALGQGAGFSRRPSRHVAIGMRGGALRPSSGYAFLRVQQASDQLAAQLERSRWRRRGVRPPRVDRRLDRFMDRVLLRHLSRHPASAPDVFAALFEGCETDRLVRFLSGSGGWRDRWAVMASLPTAPFVSASLGGLFDAR